MEGDILKWILPNPITTLNMVNLFSFTFEALFFDKCRDSTTLYSLLYALSYCHSVNKLLGRTTHHMLVVWVLKRVGK